jgi:two-component system chemotaxis response regulator CheY
VDVIEAKDGLDALEQVNFNPDLDLLLVDWNMPNMNGIQFIRAIRAQRAHDGMRILMVTSEAEAGHVNEALGAGANEYLMKPFSKEVLLAKLYMLDVLQE